MDGIDSDAIEYNSCQGLLEYAHGDFRDKYGCSLVFHDFHVLLQFEHMKCCAQSFDLILFCGRMWLALATSNGNRPKISANVNTLNMSCQKVVRRFFFVAGTTAD